MYNSKSEKTSALIDEAEWVVAQTPAPTYEKAEEMHVQTKPRPFELKLFSPKESRPNFSLKVAKSDKPDGGSYEFLKAFDYTSKKDPSLATGKEGPL